MKNFAKIIVLSQSRSDLSDGRLFIFCCWVGINDAYRKCQQWQAEVPGDDGEASAWTLDAFWVLSGGDTGWSVIDISFQAPKDCQKASDFRVSGMPATLEELENMISLMIRYSGCFVNHT